MAILVTGAAGFIGYHVSEALLARGETVIGVDNLNAYYDVSLKEARLAHLLRRERFSLARVNIADREGFNAALAPLAPSITGVIHLAAQAGVRHSLKHPFDYIEANITGHLVLMEWCRHHPNGPCPMVYASSSSVYGGNTELPFSVADRVDNPVSLYAATKKADELMSHCYAHLYRIPLTGLRFFTVYGPWGRPDMALFLFCDAIMAGRPIKVFNHGDMARDFTYVDDIVAGVLAAHDRPPADGGPGTVPHRVFNLGNHNSEPLMKLIGLIEQALGRNAVKEFEPMQPGDVPRTFADIAESTEILGFHPTTPIEVGVPKFVAWYRDYFGV
jgi:UDP-glucuronate 4-epimerase